MTRISIFAFAIAASIGAAHAGEVQLVSNTGPAELEFGGNSGIFFASGLEPAPGTTAEIVTPIFVGFDDGETVNVDLPGDAAVVTGMFGNVVQGFTGPGDDEVTATASGAFNGEPATLEAFAFPPARTRARAG